jgi:hypothetical protein
VPSHPWGQLGAKRLNDLVRYAEREIGVRQSIEVMHLSSQGKRQRLFGDAVFEQRECHFEGCVTKAHCMISFLVDKKKEAAR